MKKLIINEKTFQLENNVHKFLSDYLERIDNFVKKNQIDPELRQDILQRLADKLNEKSGKDGISQKEAIHIINNLGEAEEIFADVIDVKMLTTQKSKESFPSLKFYEKLQNASWSRPQEGAIFLGVCKMFEQVTGITVWFRRIIAVATNILAGGTYLLFALIFPIKDKDYQSRGIGSYFFTELIDLFLIFKNPFVWCFGFFAALIKFFDKWGRKVQGPLWKIILRMITVLWTLFLFCLIIFLGIVIYYFEQGFVIANIEYTSFFPAITKWGVVFGFISAFLLFFASFGSLIKKKLSNSTTIVVGIGLGILAFIVLGITLFEINNMIYQYEDVKKELTIDIPETQKDKDMVITVSDISIDLYFKHGGMFINQSNFVNIIPAEDDVLRAEYIFHITGKKGEKMNRVMENLAMPTYKWYDNQVVIGFDNQMVFDEVSPALPVGIDINLYVPKSLVFRFGGRYITAINTDVPDWAKEYGYFGRNNCKSISYKEETNSFYCDLEMTSGSRRSIIMQELENRADELAPLIGSNPARSFNSDGETYWQRNSVNILQGDRLVLKLSDRFFNFFYSIDYEVTDAGEFVIKDSKLIDFEQKGLMDEERMKYYSGWENLSDYEIIMKENEKKQTEALEERINELESQLQELRAFFPTQESDYAHIQSDEEY